MREITIDFETICKAVVFAAMLVMAAAFIASFSTLDTMTEQTTVQFGIDTAAWKGW